MVPQVTELECRLSSSTGQLAAALDANSQHLERYRDAKAEATGLAQQLDQVCCSAGCPVLLSSSNIRMFARLHAGLQTDIWVHLSSSRRRRRRDMEW